MKSPLQNGVIIGTDWRIADYLKHCTHKDRRVLSRSDILACLECPSKFNKGVTEPDKKTWQKDFGSMFDCLLTQPERRSEYFLHPPETYISEAKTTKGQTEDWTWHSPTCRRWRDEQEAAGFIVIDEDDMSAAEDATVALLEHPKHGTQTRQLLLQSHKQVFVIAEYHDQETGIVVPVKALHDLLPIPESEFADSIFDIKTIRCAAPGAWITAVFENDWHVQAAMGLDVYNATNPGRTTFRHIVVENTAPYESVYKWMEDEFIEMGRHAYISGLQKYCACIKSGEWPGYKDEFATVENGRIDKHGYESCGPTAKMVQFSPVARYEDPGWMKDPA